MDASIISNTALQRTCDAAPAGLSHDEKVLHAAGLHCVDPVRVASSLAARQSLHDAAEVAA